MARLYPLRESSRGASLVVVTCDNSGYNFPFRGCVRDKRRRKHKADSRPRFVDGQVDGRDGELSGYLSPRSFEDSGVGDQALSSEAGRGRRSVRLSCKGETTMAHVDVDIP